MSRASSVALRLLWSISVHCITTPESSARAENHIFATEMFSYAVRRYEQRHRHHQLHDGMQGRTAGCGPAAEVGA